MCLWTYLDGLSVELQTLLLVGQELLNILALIALKLNHLAHLTVGDDRAIASYRLSAFCPQLGAQLDRPSAYAQIVEKTAWYQTWRGHVSTYRTSS